HYVDHFIIHSFPTRRSYDLDHSEPVEEIVGSGMKKGDIIVGKPDAFKDYTDPSNYRDQIIAGNTNIFVGESGQITGYFSLADQVRDEAVHAVENFQNSDIEVVLLTGDNETVAEKVAGEVGITDYTASCLPEDKVRFVNES